MSEPTKVSARLGAEDEHHAILSVAGSSRRGGALLRRRAAPSETDMTTSIAVIAATVVVALVFTTYYLISRKNTSRAMSLLVALGFTAITPFIFIVAAVIIVLKFAQLLITETVNNRVTPIR